MLIPDFSHPVKIEIFKFISLNSFICNHVPPFQLSWKAGVILSLYSVKEGAFADKIFSKLTRLLVKKYWHCQEYGVDFITVLCSLWKLTDDFW